MGQTLSKPKNKGETPAPWDYQPDVDNTKLRVPTYSMTPRRKDSNSKMFNRIYYVACCALQNLKVHLLMHTTSQEDKPTKGVLLVNPAVSVADIHPISMQDSPLQPLLDYNI